MQCPGVRNGSVDVRTHRTERCHQEFPTFARSEVGSTMDPVHDLGCSEHVSALLWRVVCMVLSGSVVIKSRSDLPPPLIRLFRIRRLQYSNTRPRVLGPLRSRRSVLRYAEVQLIRDRLIGVRDTHTVYSRPIGIPNLDRGIDGGRRKSGAAEPSGARVSRPVGVLQRF